VLVLALNDLVLDLVSDGMKFDRSAAGRFLVGAENFPIAEAHRTAVMRPHFLPHPIRVYGHSRLVIRRAGEPMSLKHLHLFLVFDLVAKRSLVHVGDRKWTPSDQPTVELHLILASLSALAIE
jgi:hypothetical protein